MEFQHEKARILSTEDGKGDGRPRYVNLLIGFGFVVTLIIIAAGAIMAARQMTGTASSERPASGVTPQRARSPTVTTQASVTPTPSAPQPTPATPGFPRYVYEIPTSFRGNWDEITNDHCEGREARFYLGRTDFANFEVQYNVQRVKLYSPTEIDLETTYLDENGNQQHGTWNFALLNRGRDLTGRTTHRYRFHRCEGRR